MKSSLSVLLILGLFLAIGSSQKSNDLFQVITSHSHDLEDLAPYIDTVYQNGRLWVVEVKQNVPFHLRNHLRPLSGSEKSYLHQGRNIRNVNLDNFDLDIRETLKNIDPQNIKTDVTYLSSFKSRLTGTEENRTATAAMALRFSNMGYEVKEICFSNNKACNLVADKRGTTTTQDVILVMGHIDSVGADFAGADDNGSGVAVIMEMARVVQHVSHRKNIRFFLTNGEEQGLVGATLYAKQLQDSGQSRNIVLAINMDMVGYNSNGIVELETDKSYEDLAKWFANLAARYTKLKSKITIGAWGSDHVPFLKAQVPTILTIEDWSTKTPCYHKACDRPETLNYEYAAEIAKLNTAALLTKDLQ